MTSPATGAPDTGSENAVSPACTTASTKSCDSGTGSTESNESRHRPCPRGIRFLSAVIVVCSLEVVLLIAHAMQKSIPVIPALLYLSFGLFVHEWFFVHGSALTRARRAYFDVVNVLETYQPRARTHGHLFQPDPPTPGPVVKFDENVENNEKKADSEFQNHRDSHYANMFQHAMQRAKEMEAIEKAAAAPNLDAAASTATSPVPADPEKDKKAYQDKKKKSDYLEL